MNIYSKKCVNFVDCVYRICMSAILDTLKDWKSGYTREFYGFYTL